MSAYFLILLEEEMAVHSSILGWRISWTEEPDGLQSMGLLRVRDNQMTSRHAFFNPASFKNYSLLLSP